ncbi:hypothetical protein GOP80_08805 [Planococcaceae bacterium Storch 2/2-2]|nr:hypothetical protein [Planococcaceae bacterium Storch 2/2-2]
MRPMVKRSHFKKTALIHKKERLIGYDLPTLEREIEKLLNELTETIAYNGEPFKEATALELDIFIAKVEAQQARRNDSAFLLTIFSSLIALATVATTDLIEDWTINHLLTFTFLWIALLLMTERFFDHRMERLVLLSEYLKVYRTYKFDRA